MRYLPLALLTCGFVFLLAHRLKGQSVPDRLKTSYEPLNAGLAWLIAADSLAISANEANRLPDPVFVDAREPEEYAVSHLPGAVRLGHRDPDYAVLDGIDRDRTLVVYCTVGYRSEAMAKKLRRRGFTDVRNLYGSIYAWLLAGYPLVDEAGKTDRVHTYNRRWGGFLPDTLATKVY